MQPACEFELTPKCPCAPRSPRCSAPTLVSVSPVSYTSGLACLKPPALGGAWTAFQCQSCSNGSCKQAPKCSVAAPAKRGLLETGCQDSISCSLGTLESSTSYT